METKLNKGEQKVLERLKERSSNGILRIHTKEVERHLIHDGIYSLSVSRYMRSLRIKGVINYPDPRSNNHIYIIAINDFKQDKNGQTSFV